MKPLSERRSFGQSHTQHPIILTNLQIWKIWTLPQMDRRRTDHPDQTCCKFLCCHLCGKGSTVSGSLFFWVSFGKVISCPQSVGSAQMLLVIISFPLQTHVKVTSISTFANLSWMKGCSRNNPWKSRSQFLSCWRPYLSVLAAVCTAERSIGSEKSRKVIWRKLCPKTQPK